MIKNAYYKMAPPQIISSIAAMLCLLIDSIIIGRLLGVDAMSAYGLALPLIIIFTTIALILVCGVQVLSAKAVGCGDLEQAGECYSTSIVASLIIAALIILIIFAATDPICRLLGAGVDPGVFDLTKQYLRGYFLGAPFFLLSRLATPYLQVMGKRKALIQAVAAMTVSDIVFDLLSVFVFRAGMFGIGIGSGMSYLVSLAVCSVYFLKKDRFFRFSLKSVRWSTFAGIVSTGSPVAIVEICYVLRVYLLNRIFLSLSGAGAVAAYSVVAAPTDILFQIGLGSGEVTLMLAALSYSEEDSESLCELLRTAFLYTLILITAAVLVTELAASWIVILFLGRGSPVSGMAVLGLRLFAVAIIPTCINCVFEKYYLGIRRQAVSIMLAVCAGAVFTVPGAWIGGMLNGLAGVWIGLIAGQVATTFLLSLLVWRRARKITFSPQAYSYLGDGFGVEEENVLDCMVTDMETAVDFSRRLHRFCLERGVSQKEAYYISLCAEEIAVNVVRHGFAADRHEHQMEARAVRQKDQVVLRFQDDCTGFDPVRYVELHHGDDPVDHIGLRMVMSLSRDANYINALGMNNLTLTIAA